MNACGRFHPCLTLPSVYRLIELSQLDILLNRSSLLSQELEYILQTMTIGQIAGDQTYSKNATRCSHEPWEFEGARDNILHACAGDVRLLLDIMDFL